jgi:glycosylphosphatidylinositol transamidase (GPIT) subunit GPI8
MYQLLKRHGYDEDHILLIIADNIAYDPHNLYQGVVRVRPNGENVYENTQVDYKLGDISFSDFDSIMSGCASTRLPKVLQSGAQDNVIVFWCGHGNYGRLAWGSGTSVTGDEVADIFRRMKEQGRFRKLMLAVDACYSGSIGEACMGIPGMISVTAATPYEPSKADVKDLTMGIWLSNAFTRVFQETIDDNPNISIRDLYYYLARATTGSHVTVYNADAYGNLVHNTMSEFLGD